MDRWNLNLGGPSRDVRAQTYENPNVYQPGYMSDRASFSQSFYNANPEASTARTANDVNNPRDVFSREPTPDGLVRLTPNNIPDVRMIRDTRTVDVQVYRGDRWVNREIERKMVTLTFDLSRPPSGSEVFYKGTSYGSFRAPGGIREVGIDPRYGGQGGGSGAWEGHEAPDRRNNVGWTTLARDLDQTNIYSQSFSGAERPLDEHENDKLVSEGQLNAKWIGTTLRVVKPRSEYNAEVNQGDWRRDPGSPRRDNVFQTRNLIPPEQVEVKSLTMMLSPASARELRDHIRGNDGAVEQEFLHGIIQRDFYEPASWDPRSNDGTPA